MGGHAERMGVVHEGFLVAKPEGKRPLRRHRHRWEEYIKTDLPEVGRGTRNNLVQDRARGRHL